MLVNASEMVRGECAAVLSAQTDQLLCAIVTVTVSLLGTRAAADTPVAVEVSV